MADAADTGLNDDAMDAHLRAVSRVYGPETWDVYDLLDRSLDPRGPDLMLALAIERLTPPSVVLDVGCRDASHLIELVRATGASGVGIDPVSRLVEQARRAVASETGSSSRLASISTSTSSQTFTGSSISSWASSSRRSTCSARPPDAAAGATTRAVTGRSGRSGRPPSARAAPQRADDHRAMATLSVARRKRRSAAAQLVSKLSPAVLNAAACARRHSSLIRSPTCSHRMFSLP